jgi:hypothetical protein
MRNHQIKNQKSKIENQNAYGSRWRKVRISGTPCAPDSQNIRADWDWG